MENEKENEKKNGIGKTIIIDSDKDILELISELTTINEKEGTECIENSVVRIINGARLHFKKENGNGEKEKEMKKTYAILPNKLHLIIENGVLEIGSGMTLTIGERSEITIASTGWIEGGGCIIGNFAHISAPMNQVLYGDLNVSGFWTNDRIFPQWFGAVAYDCEDKTAYKPETDSTPEYIPESSSDAIMKAAKMAGTGEVFIPRGYYLLDKAIDLDCGVTISGETGLDNANNPGTILIAKLNYIAINWETSPQKAADESAGKIKIEPEYDKNGDCTSAEQPLVNYLLRININTEARTWKVTYPPMCTTIRNLRIKNKTFPKKFFAFDKLLACVLAGDSTVFDNVIFDGFGQAVRYINQYLDNKRVTNCTFYCNPAGYTGTLKLYAFDLGFLGDGVLFEHNAIHDGMHNKGLRISDCGGASVNANIINADVLINNCHGVDFSANHIESQHTIKINSSQASLRNNFIWIGNSPSVMVYADDYQNKSIVTMDGNVFKFNDTIFYQDMVMPSNDVFKCEAEVAVDEYSVLSISNCYRYRGGYGFGGTQTSGIGIAKLESDGTWKPLDEFNDFSYALSRSSTIGSGFEIDGNFSVHNVTGCGINPIAMLNGGTLWRGDDGEYSYSAQVVIDKRREIGLSPVDISVWGPQLTISGNKNGVLVNLGKSSGRYLLRLVRMRCDNLTFKYVDIPICDTTYLYDNGVSVNGFKWSDCENENVIVVNPTVESYEYNSGKVRVFASGRLWPDGGAWEKGDVVYLPEVNIVKVMNP